jgi:H+-transporting ATPase
MPVFFMEATGLTSKEVEKRLGEYGPNRIEEEKPSLIKKILRGLVSPISLMLLAAAFLSFLSQNLFDFYSILFLLAFNLGINIWQERKADDAISKLREQLAVKTRTLRDGAWKLVDSTLLTVGDVVELSVGDIVPADLKILEANNLTLNEASLTGESLPRERKEGETAYSGSYIATGKALGVVEAVGSKTYFGKTIMSLDKTVRQSALERDILTISKFLSILSLLCVVFLTVFFMLLNRPIIEILTLDLSLVIAGIPVALPTVMALIISLGVLELANKKVIVRRLSSLEDLANVNLLFTDKTGTMTKNQIVIEKIISYGYSDEEILSHAYLTAVKDDRSVINKAIIKKAQDARASYQAYKILDYTPADSERKRSSALVEMDRRKEFVSVGAPQVIASLCKIDSKTKAKFEKDVKEAARAGYRSLAVAVNHKGVEKGMELAGLLLLSDPLREDAKDVIRFMQEKGIDVKMLTGDNAAIGNRIGAELDLGKDDVFCEVLPADKYKIVSEAHGRKVTAVTGDGVNDLPAMKSADVSIAVSNAVDALKSFADIVLLSPGIAVVKDAIIEARKVFSRLYTYSVYRISESLRVIVSILLLSIIYGAYPLTPIQLILLALMNDIPIVSLAFDRVKLAPEPAKIKVKERFVLSTLFGLVGVFNSLIFFVLLYSVFHIDLAVVATLFFLKLTVSGHLLIYVAHTDDRWFKFLPSREVIAATMGTQLIATCLAVFGIFIKAAPLPLVLFVWVWAVCWMQVSELMKDLQKRIVVER